MIPILVPDLGDGIDKVEVAAWHFAEGALVTMDEDLLELVTDKASFHLQAPASGVLKKIHAGVGQEVAIGGLLGEIE